MKYLSLGVTAGEIITFLLLISIVLNKVSGTSRESYKHIRRGNVDTDFDEIVRIIESELTRILFGYSEIHRIFTNDYGL